MRLNEREIKLWHILVFVFFLLPLVLGAMNWRDKRVVNKIIVKGNKVIPSEKIIKLAGVKLGERIVELNLSELRGRIEKHKFIRFADVYTNLPDAIFIEIVEREPIAMFTSKGKIYFVDLEGVVIPAEEVGRLFSVPFLGEIEKPVANVNFDSTGLRNCFELLKIALEKRVYELISELRVKNGEIVLLTTDGAVPVFLGEGEFDKKLVYLREFWKQVVLKRGYPSYIDLRYSGSIFAKFDSKN